MATATGPGHREVSKLAQARFAMTPCMPCSFGLFHHARSGADGPLIGPRGLTILTAGYRW
jgi:hypothetical protein